MGSLGLSTGSRESLLHFLVLCGEMDSVNATELATGVKTAEALLKAAVREQFIAGTDKEGRSHNKTGQTLATLSASIEGMIGVVTMGRGAVYVQYGSRPHVISARNGPYMTFQTSWGWVRKASINSPGFAGDDFAGRAFEEVDGLTLLGAVYGRILARFAVPASRL